MWRGFFEFPHIFVYIETKKQIKRNIMNDERIILTDEILEQQGFKKGEFEWSGYAINENLFLVHTGMTSNHSYEVVASDPRADICTGIYIDYLDELNKLITLCMK